ncbi:hypothetical protein E1212_13680, partial [Jiangella ureilytica]
RSGRRGRLGGGAGRVRRVGRRRARRARRAGGGRGAGRAGGRAGSGRRRRGGGRGGSSRAVRAVRRRGRRAGLGRGLGGVRRCVDHSGGRRLCPVENGRGHGGADPDTQCRHRPDCEPRLLLELHRFLLGTRHRIRRRRADPSRFARPRESIRRAG